MSNLSLKPTAAPVRAYYATLQKFAKARFDNEGNIRGAFEDLLKKCARQYDWTLVPKYQKARKYIRRLSTFAHCLKSPLSSRAQSRDLQLSLIRRTVPGAPEPALSEVEGSRF